MWNIFLELRNSQFYQLDERRDRNWNEVVSRRKKLDSMQRFVKLLIRIDLNNTKKYIQISNTFWSYVGIHWHVKIVSAAALKTCKMVISLWILKAYITRYLCAYLWIVITTQLCLSFHRFCGFLLIHITVYN